MSGHRHPATATLHVLRHVSAGVRGAGSGPDHLRPADDKGRRQAAALVDLLRRWPLDRIVTSPYLRCVESVVPVAEDRGLPVEEANFLAEGAGVGSALGRLGTLAGGELWCSHGDVIAALVDHLAGAGVPMGPSVWKKASIWRLTLRDGVVTRGEYVPPPV